MTGASRLFLLEPGSPTPAWAPFAGARPIAELRAGVWRIRERWEAALDLDTEAILGPGITEFTEIDSPRCIAPIPITGPAVVADSRFAPTGEPIILAPETRQLVAVDGTPVGWVVPAGATWSGPGDGGPGQPVKGIYLRQASDLITALEQLLPADCLGFAAADADPVPAGSIVLGDAALVLCRGAIVEPGVVFDTRAGAIVLEQGVEVRHGTRLEGPLYAGDRSRILGGHLRASALGPRCSVKGEVSNTVMLGYANKSHDGFVGHSVIGHWVNLGAGTTTSNLKNTYGEVSLEIAGVRLATGRQFLGSLIGDHAKIAIGTMLPTGTVIGAGANLFGSSWAPKYVPPLAWGTTGRERITEAGFLRIAERVMPRRDVEFSEPRRASLAAIYHRLAGP